MTLTSRSPVSLMARRGARWGAIAMLLLVVSLHLAVTAGNDSIEGVGLVLMILGMPWTILVDSIAMQTASRNFPFDVFAYGQMLATVLNGALLGGGIGAAVGWSTRRIDPSGDHEPRT